MNFPGSDHGKLPLLHFNHSPLPNFEEKMQSQTATPAKNAEKPQTALQSHVAFFDTDHDDMIWPLDTYDSGFHFIQSLFIAVPQLQGLPRDWIRHFHLHPVHDHHPQRILVRTLVYALILTCTDASPAGSRSELGSQTRSSASACPICIAYVLLLSEILPRLTYTYMRSHRPNTDPTRHRTRPLGSWTSTASTLSSISTPRRRIPT